MTRSRHTLFPLAASTSRPDPTLPARRIAGTAARTACASILGLASAASADVVEWNGKVDPVLWTEPDSWIGGAVPGPNDTARFNSIGGSSSSLFPVDTLGVSVGALEFVGGSHSIRLSEQTIFTTTAASAQMPSVTVGVDRPTFAELEGLGSSIVDHFFLGDVVVGLSAPGSLSFDSAAVDLRTLEIGRHAQGDVSLWGFGQPNTALDMDRLLIGTGAPGTNVFETGWLERIRVREMTIVGMSSFGTLRQLDPLELHDVVVGSDANSVGRAWVREPFSATGNVDVGLLGVGRIDLLVGGEIGGDLVVGVSSEGTGMPFETIGEGDVLLQSGADLNVDGDVWIGFAGNGRIELERSARLTTSGSISTGNIGVNDNRALVLHVRPGASDALPMVDAEGPASLPQVRLRFDPDAAGSIEPKAGDEWLLVQAESIAYEALTLPQLPGSLEWVVDDSMGRLVVRIVGTTSPADIDVDGDVDLVDLLIVLSEFGACAGPICPGDLNNDSVVDIVDLVRVLADWTG
ncbi:MAG: hypothetical protein AB8G96_09075 [Phycisphaerales bacterium]